MLQPLDLKKTHKKHTTILKQSLDSKSINMESFLLISVAGSKKSN